MKNLISSCASNIYRGWKTTLLGIVLFCATIASVFMVEAVTWADAIVPIVFALMLILMPDKVKKAMSNFIDKKAVAILILMGAALVFLSSCKPSEENRQSQATPTQIKTTDTIRNVVKHHFKADSASLTVVPSAMTPGIVYESKSGKATASVVQDKWGELHVKADCKAETVYDTVYIQVERLTEIAPSIIQEKVAPAKDTLANSVFKEVLIPVIILILVFFLIIRSAIYFRELIEKAFTSRQP